MMVIKIKVEDDDDDNDGKWVEWWNTRCIMEKICQERWKIFQRFVTVILNGWKSMTKKVPRWKFYSKEEEKKIFFPQLHPSSFIIIIFTPLFSLSLSLSLTTRYNCKCWYLLCDIIYYKIYHKKIFRLRSTEKYHFIIFDADADAILVIICILYLNLFVLIDNSKGQNKEKVSNLPSLSVYSKVSSINKLSRHQVKDGRGLPVNDQKKWTNRWKRGGKREIQRETIRLNCYCLLTNSFVQ